MTPQIISDNDLRKVLNTPAKRDNWAKSRSRLASAALQSASLYPKHDMFSRTFFVTLTDNTEVVIQFRTEPLDVEAFSLAGTRLRSVVPRIQALKDEDLEEHKVWAYSLDRMPGKMWLHGVAGKGAGGRIAVNKSLGCVFSKGFVGTDSVDAVNNKIHPNLQAKLSSPLEEIARYRDICRKYAEKLDELTRIPLWISHYYLSEVNILIDDNCEVTALTDWVLSNPLPFGIGFGRIHTLAAEYTGGKIFKGCCNTGNLTGYFLSTYEHPD